MVSYTEISTAYYRNAVILMLNTAAHFRKKGNKEAARRAINTLKGWRFS